MINFHLEPDMFVARPKVQLADYVDLTMPLRDWTRYDTPADRRLPARTVCAAEFREKLSRYISIQQAG